MSWKKLKHALPPEDMEVVIIYRDGEGSGWNTEIINERNLKNFSDLEVFWKELPSIAMFDMNIASSNTPYDVMVSDDLEFYLSLAVDLLEGVNWNDIEHKVLAHKTINAFSQFLLQENHI